MIHQPAVHEEDGEPSRLSLPSPPFMHMFVQFEMAFRYCYGSRFVCAPLVVRVVISNGNYTRHFRTSKLGSVSQFRDTSRRSYAGMAIYGATDTSHTKVQRFTNESVRRYVNTKMSLRAGRFLRPHYGGEIMMNFTLNPQTRS